MTKERSNLESTHRNEFGGIFGSWFWIEIPIGQCLELRSNSAILYQTIVFFTVMKPYNIYIYQIKDREMLIKNSGPYLENHLRLDRNSRKATGL